jgi:serine/threonine-protein kinase
MIGRTIGKYRIVGQIGRGATGVVYQALDETLGREVAIKVLHADIGDEQIMRRFRAEATTLARLNHPEIATVYDLLPTETELLLVMEFVRGETLEQLSRRVGPMAPDRAAYFTDRVLAALQYAHRAGIVHRDMKPANVMVAESGGIKIMDFGTARVRGAEHMTVDGSVLGTPAYMAPEQVLGRDVDERADLYSVGVLFYRLLSGALPFEADTPLAMMQRQLSEPPVPLHARRPDVPRWCEDILERALAKSPDDRFQKAEEFRQAIGRSTGTVSSEPATAFISAEPDVAAGEPETLKTMVMPRAEASRSSARAGWIAVAAVIVTIAAYVAMRRGGELMSATTLPAVAFDTTALVASGGTHREREAVVVLADGSITVTATDDTARALHTVPYNNVESISYSRGRDPMWNSPDGPARVARSRGGVLGKWGIFVDRHWISLKTESDSGFVILRVGDEQVAQVLGALEERTGRTPHRITGSSNPK